MPWLTPADATPTGITCRVLLIPDDLEYIQAVTGALLELTYPYNWEQYGAATPDEVAALFQTMLFEYLESECEVAAPVGATMLWHMPTPPSRWIICDGQGVLKSEYPELFALFGAKYGTSPDFFGVPDLRGRIPYGEDFTVPLDADFGEAQHTLTSNEIPAHAHGQQVGASPVYLGTGGSGRVAYGAVTTASLVRVVTDNAGGGQAHNNIPPVRGVNFIVYGGKP